MLHLLQYTEQKNDLQNKGYISLLVFKNNKKE